MKKIIFLLTFLLIQKVFTQTNDTTLFPYQICYIATDSGLGYSIGDVIEFNVMYNLENPTEATYFDYFNQNRQAFVYKDNSRNGQSILGAMPPIAHLKPCIGNVSSSTNNAATISTKGEAIVFNNLSTSTQSYNLVNKVFKNIVIYNNGTCLLSLTYFTTSGSANIVVPPNQTFQANLSHTYGDEGFFTNIFAYSLVGVSTRVVINFTK